MKFRSLLRTLVLGVIGGSAAHIALAQSAIHSFSQAHIDLYEAPDLSANKQKIAVPPGKPDSDWQVIGSKTRFYQIKAGPHGVGWALRSKIIVSPDSPIVVAPCKRTDLASSEHARLPIGGAAGANAGC